MSNTARRKTELIRRKKLTKLLNQCTPKQVEFFRKIFPKGVPSHKLKSAADLCKRTIREDMLDASVRPLREPKGGTDWLSEKVDKPKAGMEWVLDKLGI